VTLPQGVDDDHIDATCSHGVLEATVKLAENGADTGGRKIAVRQDQHIKPT
jgi:HSP20 family molecular chaperone IbpA